MPPPILPSTDGEVDATPSLPSDGGISAVTIWFMGGGLLHCFCNPFLTIKSLTYVVSYVKFLLIRETFNVWVHSEGLL